MTENGKSGKWKFYVDCNGIRHAVNLEAKPDGLYVDHSKILWEDVLHYARFKCPACREEQALKGCSCGNCGGLLYFSP